MYKNMRSRTSLKSMERSASNVNSLPGSPTKDVVYEKAVIKRKKDPLIEREKMRVLQEKR